MGFHIQDNRPQPEKDKGNYTKDVRKQNRNLKPLDTALQDNVAWAGASNADKLTQLRAVALQQNKLLFAIKRYLLGNND